MRILISLLRITVAVALSLPLVLYFSQERLIFLPQPYTPEVGNAIKRSSSQAGELEITARDGTRLHGWLHHNSGAQRAPLVIYFGGNAEEISGVLLDAGSVKGVALAAVNYRGYGLSAGTPSEAALFSDALEIHDRLAARSDIDAARIVVLGRSLGSGVATYVAASRPVRGVVLVTPYDSLTAVAQRKYPIVPVSWILKHPFDSYSRAAAIKAPLLILAARDDTLIPVAHAERLLSKWGGPRRMVVLDNVSHETVDSHPDYWPGIRAFLAQVGLL